MSYIKDIRHVSIGALAICTLLAQTGCGEIATATSPIFRSSRTW